MLFLVALAMIVSSSFLYFAEQTGANFVGGQWIRSDGNPSPFQSIPETFWWSIVTMTTGKRSIIIGVL